MQGVTAGLENDPTAKLLIFCYFPAYFKAYVDKYSNFFFIKLKS